MLYNFTILFLPISRLSIIYLLFVSFNFMEIVFQPFVWYFFLTYWFHLYYSRTQQKIKRVSFVDKKGFICFFIVQSQFTIWFINLFICVSYKKSWPKWVVDKSWSFCINDPLATPSFVEKNYNWKHQHVSLPNTKFNLIKKS